nr:hypothetical protein [Paenibacillus sp. MER 99-2]
MRIENISSEERMEAIRAFESTIHKLENALVNMTQKGTTNTTLVQKRLTAVHIGLAMLDHTWHGTPLLYTEEEIREAHHTITGLFPTLEIQYAKAKAGSAQKTLLERRIRAFELAVQMMSNKKAADV